MALPFSGPMRMSMIATAAKDTLTPNSLSEVSIRSLVSKAERETIRFSDFYGQDFSADSYNRFMLLTESFLPLVPPTLFYLSKNIDYVMPPYTIVGIPQGDSEIDFTYSLSRELVGEEHLLQIGLPLLKQAHVDMPSWYSVISTFSVWITGGVTALHYPVALYYPDIYNDSQWIYALTFKKLTYLTDPEIGSYRLIEYNIIVNARLVNHLPQDIGGEGTYGKIIFFPQENVV